jgi:hypothetical protein
MLWIRITGLPDTLYIQRLYTSVAIAMLIYLKSHVGLPVI